jgi:hypothetical protein
MIKEAATATTSDCIIMASPPGEAPRIFFRGRRTLMARAVWITANGDPGHLLVLHSCSEGSGEKGCININHLYLGDARQNAADKMAAGRWVKGRPHSKLSASQAEDVRAAYAAGGFTQAQLAEIYDVARTTVGAIVRRENWRD